MAKEASFNFQVENHAQSVAMRVIRVISCNVISVIIRIFKSNVCSRKQDNYACNNCDKQTALRGPILHKEPSQDFFYRHLVHGSHPDQRIFASTNGL